MRSTAQNIGQSSNQRIFFGLQHLTIAVINNQTKVLNIHRNLKGNKISYLTLKPSKIWNVSAYRIHTTIVCILRADWMEEEDTSREYLPMYYLYNICTSLLWLCLITLINLHWEIQRQNYFSCTGRATWQHRIGNNRFEFPTLF